MLRSINNIIFWFLLRNYLEKRNFFIKMFFKILLKFHQNISRTIIKNSKNYPKYYFFVFIEEIPKIH